MIDTEEHLERMCPKCQSDATSNKCIRCGKPLGNGEPEFVNPNFDAERFNTLSQDRDGTYNEEDDIDHELINKILGERSEG